MYPWTFQQIEGRDERKRLELKGWSAPFGRARKSPLFTEVVKSRTQTTYYPGTSGKPVRHAFGTNHEPIELNGRWMSQQLYKDADGMDANMMADVWKAFVKDQRQCRMSWGLILSYEVFIEELHLARESEHQIAWKMKIHIDKDESAGASASVSPQAINLDSSQFDAAFFLFGSNPMAGLSIPDMSPDFLDQLDNLAAALNGPSAALNRLVGEVADMEKAAFSTIQHFRSAVTGFDKALVAMNNVIQAAEMDRAVLVRSADSDIAWTRYRSDFDDRATKILGRLAFADRQAALKGQGEPSKFITARDGETWDSLSFRATGGIAQSAAIRAANGAQYGEQPESGETYIVL